VRTDGRAQAGPAKRATVGEHRPPLEKGWTAAWTPLCVTLLTSRRRTSAKVSAFAVFGALAQVWRQPPGSGGPRRDGESAACPALFRRDAT